LSGAIQDYDQAQALGYRDARLYNNRGKAWHRLEDAQKAIADYNEALRINPEYTKAYENRGDVQRQAGKYEAAIKDYRMVENLTEAPDADLLRRLGDTYFDGKMFVQAHDYFDRLVAS